MTRRLRTGLTVTDMFCGAGGTSIGVVAAGADLRWGLNHWQLAVEVHADNFPDAGHDCCDVSATDPRRYSSTDILVASPECTTHSLARAKSRGLPLFEKPDPSVERSRVTMWDVVRFTEAHRYEAVVVENVAEIARWEPFSAWLQAMTLMGYDHRVVSLNSFAAPPTPQSRDRVYVVFWRKGNTPPDLDVRPAAWCPDCERQVEGVQSWKRPDRLVGKYRQQYVYRCGECTSEVWPFAAPASTAIDWTLEGQRIGDRARPLKPATMNRIREGLRRYARPLLVQTGGHTFARKGYVRAWPTDQPSPTQTATPHHALLVPLSHSHGQKRCRSTDEPHPAQTARQEHALVFGHYGGNTKDGNTRPVSEPISAVTANDHHALLVPYYSTGVAKPTSEPVSAVTTRDRHALVDPAEHVEDCTFRMLEPHEIKAAMAFPAGYKLAGTKRDQVKLAGNAVTPPVATLLFGRVAETLGGRRTA